MCQQKEKYCSSHKHPEGADCLDRSIGDLFRMYGEAYIKTYQPDLQKIKFIRSVRVCKTPALGGKAIVCNSCGHKHKIYLSCGNSQCPLCQSIKREQWKDKLSAKLLNVPYMHAVFTIPHELNRLAKLNKTKIYGLILRASWATVKNVCADPKNLGALPGLVNMLHTFGSDMKYHLHAHCMITFGGLHEGQWMLPKDKRKLAPFREISNEFRKVFLHSL